MLSGAGTLLAWESPKSGQTLVHIDETDCTCRTGAARAKAVTVATALKPLWWFCLKSSLTHTGGLGTAKLYDLLLFGCIVIGKDGWFILKAHRFFLEYSWIYTVYTYIYILKARSHRQPHLVTTRLKSIGVWPSWMQETDVGRIHWASLLSAQDSGTQRATFSVLVLVGKASS